MVRLFQNRLFHPPVHPSGQRRRIQTVVVVDICPRVSEVGDPLNSEALFERSTDQMGGMRRAGGDQHIGSRSCTDGLGLFQGVAVPAFSGIGQKEISTDPLGRPLAKTRTRNLIGKTAVGHLFAASGLEIGSKWLMGRCVVHPNRWMNFMKEILIANGPGSLTGIDSDHLHLCTPFCEVFAQLQPPLNPRTTCWWPVIGQDKYVKWSGRSHDGGQSLGSSSFTSS